MLNQSEVEVLHLHACLQMQYQQPQKALTLLKAIVLCAPEFRPAQTTLALVCLEAQEYQASVTWCQTLLDVKENSDKSALLLCLSRAYWRLNEPQKAREAYGLYIDSHQDNQLNTIDGSPNE